MNDEKQLWVRSRCLGGGILRNVEPEFSGWGGSVAALANANVNDS